MSTDNERANNLALQLEGQTSLSTASETLLDITEMYQSIGKTLLAIENTTVDGESTVGLDAELQAYANKRLLPDTEIQMLHNNAVPMSEADVKEFREINDRRESLQYRKQQLGITAKKLPEIRGAIIEDRVS